MGRTRKRTRKRRTKKKTVMMRTRNRIEDKEEKGKVEQKEEKSEEGGQGDELEKEQSVKQHRPTKETAISMQC